MNKYQASIIFENELQPKQGLKITQGIHSNCEVTSLEKGENFVDINFKDSENRTHNKRLWEPTGNYPRKDSKTGVEETKQQAIEREEVSNMAHIVKVLHIFLGEDQLGKVGGSSYEEFVDSAIKAATPKLGSKKVNLKLIYDQDGKYSVFGNFPDYIEEYVPGQEPTLKFSKWELENRCGNNKSDDTPKSGDALASLFN